MKASPRVQWDLIIQGGAWLFTHHSTGIAFLPLAKASEMGKKISAVVAKDQLFTSERTKSKHGRHQTIY